MSKVIHEIDILILIYNCYFNTNDKFLKITVQKNYISIIINLSNMKVIDKLAWIELKDKSILSTRSYGKDKYYIPGGKRESGETDAQALCREIQEELSITINHDTMKLLGIFQAQAHGHPEGTVVKMTCYMANYSGEMIAASEIEEVTWLTYVDKDKISEVDKLIFDFLKEKNLLS